MKKGSWLQLHTGRGMGLYKREGNGVLTELFNMILDSEVMSHACGKSVLVPILKNKGDVQL